MKLNVHVYMMIGAADATFDMICEECVCLEGRNIMYKHTGGKRKKTYF